MFVGIASSDVSRGSLVLRDYLSHTNCIPCNPSLFMNAEVNIWGWFLGESHMNG